MKLNPKIAPGRSNHKARQFASEIAELSLNGYGCRAIREALAEAGISVSKSTVQRELARLSKPPPHRITSPTAARLHQTAAPTASVVSKPRVVDDARSGKDIAESFMKGRITNPLFRSRSVK